MTRLDGFLGVILEIACDKGEAIIHELSMMIRLILERHNMCGMG
jgi:hypothetical protein